MSDYTDFVASLREWANREDWSDTRVAEFIRMGEGELNRVLRVREMATQIVPSPDADGAFDVPADWLGTIFVQVNGEPLRYATPEEFAELGTANRGRYSMLGSTVALGGLYGTPTIKFTYWARVPSFTSAPGSNTWVQQKYYQPFLWSCLIYAGAFGLEDERVARIKADLYDAIATLNMADSEARVSGSPLVRRTTRSLG